jgi:hypothetical protein
MYCSREGLSFFLANSHNRRSNILLILVDNFGYGELGVYGGGATRGAPTPRLDKLASEGLRLTNMNMEPQCTPSRSSILTGRFAIRSGTYAVPLGGVPDGLTQWEVTIAEVLSDAGYDTALYGKWHLGSHDGRLPNDQGFDEWWGIPRITDEAMWPSHPQWSAKIAPPEYIMEGTKGKKSRALTIYDLEQRRLIDGVDQSDFFLGRGEHSQRDGFPIWVDNRLQAVKWRNWKMHFYRQDTMADPPVKFPVPVLYNLYTDPREEKPTINPWVLYPMLKIVRAFEESLKKCPLIPMGTLDPYEPPAAWP